MKNKSNGRRDSHVTQTLTEQRIAKPRYSIRKDLGFWRLRFAGKEAVFKSEVGAGYVAYLLLNPPEQPIHALDLLARVSTPEQRRNGIAELVDLETGRMRVLDADARVQERSLGQDEARAMKEVLRTQNQLEALLEDEDVCEPERREAERELIALYDYETANTHRVKDSAQRAADAVAKAIKRFYEHLANAVEGNGGPHRVLRRFAEHIRLYLLIPSGRYCARGGPRPGVGLAGCFTYERPGWARWEQ